MYSFESRLQIKKGAKATLFAFGDIQAHSSGFRAEILQEFKKDFLSTPNAYAIGLGDYGDFLRVSKRGQIASVLSGDPSARRELDDIIKGDVEKLSQKIDFMKGKILYLHSGHHEWDYRDGTNSTQQLCRILDTQYAGWCALNVLRITGPQKSGGSKGSTVSVKIFSTHGSGGSSFSSGDMANLEKKIAPYWIADLYFRGHSSKGELAPLELNDITMKGIPRIVKKTRWIVNCPGMMNGYTMGETDYVEAMNLPPASLGYAKVEITFSSNLDTALDGKGLTGVRLQPMIVSPHIYHNG